ncbi:hypothetical protein AMECASPLE_029282 [Ameca splendens]|uniref:Uncharacterized protein n=1 Tax=Ameca splendens TaxID=208324 RepID=A0ABV0YH53_9TELE
MFDIVDGDTSISLGRLLPKRGVRCVLQVELIKANQEEHKEEMPDCFAHMSGNQALQVWSPYAPGVSDTHLWFPRVRSILLLLSHSWTPVVCFLVPCVCLENSPQAPSVNHFAAHVYQ